MRRCLCANVNVMVDDVDVTIDDDDVTIDDVDVTVDDDDVMFTHNGLKLIYIRNYAHVPATPILEYSWPCMRVLTSRSRESQ